MESKTILFFCTENSARSQMAEAFTRHYGAEDLEVFSAGTAPKAIHPLTIKVMEEIGFDMSTHFSKSVDDLGKLPCEYLVTVCSDAEEQCPVTFADNATHVHWDVEDPAAFRGEDVNERIGEFRQVRDQIREKVLDWLHEIGVPAKP